MKGTIGDYRNMEVVFKVDKDKTPYHAQLYRIPIAHVELTKQAINDMVENNTLEKHTKGSERAPPPFGLAKKNQGK